MLDVSCGLVAGERMAPNTMMNIRVLRGFFYERVPQPIGAVLSVPHRFAAEMCALGKAERYEPPSEEPRKLLRMEGALTIAPPPSTQDEMRPRRKGGRPHVE